MIVTSYAISHAIFSRRDTSTLEKFRKKGHEDREPEWLQRIPAKPLSLVGKTGNFFWSAKWRKRETAT